jgi:archaellum component FlaC
MDEVQPDYSQIFGDINTKVRDLEEKQKILKDRLLLIGENMIEIKDETGKKILDIKKDIEILKRNTEKLISFLETVSGEFSKFARKEDVEILARQLKMFQPLGFIKRAESQKLNSVSGRDR